MRGGWFSTLLIYVFTLIITGGLFFLAWELRFLTADTLKIPSEQLEPFLLWVVLIPGLAVPLLWRNGSRRRTLWGIESTLRSLSHPSGSGLQIDPWLAQDPQCAPLLRCVADLATSQQELTERLQSTQDQLEAFQRDSLTNSDSAIGESGIFNAPPGSRYVVGSSRQRMVARLTPGLQWLGATAPLLRYLGCTGRDLVSRSFLDFVYQEDVPTLQQVLEEAVQDGEGHNIIFQILAHNPEKPTVPELRHVQLDVMTCYSDRGIPQHLRCHLLDITEKVRTESELRRRTQELSEANTRLRQINHDLQRLKESYRDLYHNAPVLYFSLDIDGRFAALNETLLRTLGYSRDELMGQHYTLLLRSEDQQTFLNDPTVFQHPGEIEARWVKRNGVVIDVWIGTTTIKDARGHFVRSRSAARDVSERNRLEQALQTKAEEIIQANTRLRQINQELEDFTYVVSHDLKEPLRTLEAFSNFLAQDYGNILQGDGQEYINHLIQASKRLARLIDDLLTLSRVGRVLKNPVPFDWDAVIATVTSDLHELIQQKTGIVRVEGKLPEALGDPERIGQLLTNLISNGLKYNQSEQPEVVIGAKPDTSQGEVLIYVRDNGIGIDPEYHEQIFRIFRRLHHREEFDGTGAGLAICRKIVVGHGGQLWVESTAGAGSTFYFTLPAAAHEPNKGPGTPNPVNQQPVTVGTV